MTNLKAGRAPVTAVTVRVPAKINLQLSVGPLRDDGYHDLVTVFHAISLYDEVTVSPAARTSVEVTGEGGPAVPLGPANLAVRAASTLARSVGRRGRGAGSGGSGGGGADGWGGAGGSGVKITISKRIPVAAGLAGGSADAAAALVACNELWQAGLSVAQLSEIGARIGSDVPFAISGGTAVGLGRGERLTRALVSGGYHWVLAFGAGGLSTPEVYAACDRLRAGRPDDAGSGATALSAVGSVPPPSLNAALMSALRSGDPAAVGAELSNDLQPAAISLKPVLRRALAAGREFGALGAIVSGSGPTCAFLAADADRAQDLALALSGAGVCRAVAQATGPVPGATVISSGGRR